MLSAAERQAVLDLAAEAIDYGLRHGQPPPVDSHRLPPALQARRACFVTLTLHGELRGCIGSLEAYRPLAEDVSENAFAAAFRDPRFPPLSSGERRGIHLHVSVLEPAQPLTVSSEADLLAQLRPGVDGLVLEEGARRATFLPSVWTSLPDAGQFLRALKRKAGLPEDYWPKPGQDTLRFARYTVEDIE